MAKPKVAIIGSGNIGVDLAERILNAQEFDLIGLIGRRSDSPGLARMAQKGVRTYSEGLEGFLKESHAVDGFFDATSAFDHVRHWNQVSKIERPWMVDLTPSGVGEEVIPIIDQDLIRSGLHRNFNMVTCGGQSSSPLLHAMTRHAVGVGEVEISSSIASDSAGPATRRNLDHYIEATEAIAQRISGAPSKAILVLNPALPQVMMRTSVTVSAESMDLDRAEHAVSEMVNQVAEFVPGYRLVLPPTQIAPQVYMSTVSVEGEGYYLPTYSGNLDIINAAAVSTARLLSGMGL
jgi:acetaldehyde dehydrogenase (acetylating)